MAKVHAKQNSVTFWCPGCKVAHRVKTNAGGWVYNNDPESPTISPSIRVFDNHGTICHSFVRDGKIQFLNDCMHDLAGQTIDLPEWE